MKKTIIFLLAIFFSSRIFAQSAQVITDVLDSQVVTLGQICYLSAIRQNLMTDENENSEIQSEYSDAIKILSENDRLIPDGFYNDKIQLKYICYIFAKTFNVEGGLFYKITGGSPRYAFKQFKSDGVILENSDPNSFISGQKALDILTNCIFKYDEVSFDYSDEESEILNETENSSESENSNVNENAIESENINENLSESEISNGDVE